MAGQWVVVALVLPLVQGHRLDRGRARRLLVVARDLGLGEHWGRGGGGRMGSVSEEGEEELEDAILSDEQMVPEGEHDKHLQSTPLQEREVTRTG